MKVILLKDVQGMGKKFDLKTVAEGHALNFLIPRGLAKVATDDVVKKAEVEKARWAEERKIQEDLMIKNLKQLAELTIHIHEKANPKGHLFAGLHAQEIAALVKKESQLDVAPEWIQLDKPIKSVGEHVIEVKVQDKVASFKLVVEAK
jgi:large subunit ribosomal protein L9